MSKLKNKCIGITLGDPSGIGPEVIAKALAKPRIRNISNFQIIGDVTSFNKYFKKSYSNCSFIEVNKRNSSFKIGSINSKSGLASLKYLEKAVDMLKDNKISALVTGPVCKEAVKMHCSSFKGHTEFLADSFNIKNVGMFFIADNFRVIIATRHLPLRNVSSEINTSKIYKTIELTNNALRDLFNIKSPKIGILGLNPHAGERGKIGDEEIKYIIPAIKKANKKGIRASGPFPADTLFSFDFTDKYDAVIAMYHDQGLIPIKTLCFKKLVNLTIGLPFIRTSPAHGTAFNLAGKNTADETPMCEAIKLAVLLSK